MKAYTSILISTLFIACSGEEKSNEEGHDHQESMEMAMVEARVDTVYHTISCNGEVDVPPQSRATISSPLSGYVREVRFYPGERVRKNEYLARIAPPEFIELQHQYLDAQANLTFLETDLERKRTLLSQNAVNSRTIEELESKVSSERARMRSTEARLKQIGIDPNDVEADNIQSELILRSPIDGYITGIDVNLGQHVNAEQRLYEIVDDEHMHIELNVFPQDIAKVKYHQVIEFTIPGNTETFRGEVQQIGRQLNDESGAYMVHAHADEHGDHLRPGQFVEGKIFTNPTIAILLPTSAIDKSEETPAVYVAEGDHYVRREVRTGRQFGQYTQILDPLDVPVVKDCYYLLESEGGHSH